MIRHLVWLALLCGVSSLERPCEKQICLNGGSCRVDDDSRRFKCYCPAGFSGSLCENECHKNCVNGVCIKGENNVEECKCQEGWTGVLCEMSGGSILGCTRKEDCAEEEDCIQNEKGFRMCMTDPCKDNPCKNNATCSVDKDTYKCLCPLGYGGPMCDNDVNECEMSPCRNGGTCINLEGSFTCLCPEKFRGILCADTGSPCLPSPCENNATCLELADEFHCSCPAGFSGKTCEMALTTDTACSPNPCQNNGLCLEGAGSFECRCLPGFQGELCEKDAPCTVDGKMCMNGGTCIRGLALTHCQCPPDYGGLYCESLEIMATTVDVCQQKPCLNGGTCSVINGEAKCQCSDNFYGPFCGAVKETDACLPNPCHNDGVCTPVGDPAEAGFTCSCISGFSGHQCEEEEETPETTTSTTITSTTTSTTSTTTTSTTRKFNSLAQTSTYAPQFIEPTVSTNQIVSTCEKCEHADKCLETSEGSICICQKGFSGVLCDQLGEVCDSSRCQAPFTCRPLITVSDTQIKCACPKGKIGSDCSKDSSATFDQQSLFIYQSPSVMIGSSNGPLPYVISLTFRTTVPNVHIVSGENIFAQRLFSVSLISGRLSLNMSGTVYSNLLSIPVNDGSMYTLEITKLQKDLKISVSEENGYEILSRSLPRLAQFDVFSTRIGKVSEESYFVGCLSDVSIGGEMIGMASSNRAVQIKPGCFREPQCAKNKCHNDGICVDLWNDSICQCKPPFLAPLCIYSLPPSTFGHDNLSSLAQISVPAETSEDLRFDTTVQMIVRTNKPTGAIAYLGEGNVDDVGTFMALEMINGTVEVRVRAGGKQIHKMRSRRKITDNEDHLIRVERHQRHVQLFVDDILEVEGDIPSRFDHPLFVEKLVLGSCDNSTKSAFFSCDFFKGSLQDIRVNENSAVLQNIPSVAVDGLGRIDRLENVLEGSISDDVCVQQNPCQKGSCENTFNDYQCVCHKGYFGRNCDQKDYCVADPCPSGGVCQNVRGGFICTSPVSFVSTSSMNYQLESLEPIDFPHVQLSIRTHSESGRILTLNSVSGNLMLSISNKQLVITTSSAFTIRKTIADGTWKTIRIEANILKINNASYALPPSLSMPGKTKEASLTLATFNTFPSFVGCLQDVSIGDLPPISFYKQTESQMGKDLSYWKIVDRKKISTTCMSVPQCAEYSTCLNGGVCVDNWNTFTCQCPDGFNGKHCEKNVDECLHVDCGHGYCIDGINDYRCECDEGFSGKNCELSTDFCVDNPCKNQGICDSVNGTLSCECREGWVGRTCEIEKPISCDNGPCQNEGVCSMGKNGPFCRCRPGYTGDYCELEVDPCSNRPCSHGTCQKTRTGHTCICEEGYTGLSCNEVINNCQDNSCGNNGLCKSVWNNTICDCDKAWRGLSCAHDADECINIPCENDGKCTNSVGSFSCECRKYYMGDFCEVEGSCLSNPCQHGECVQLKHDEHTCSCHKGYEGENCDIKIDYCKNSPCRNGATCESLLGYFVCHCIPGFSGTNCEHDIDECAQGFCSNGAMCRDRVADYECICDGTGFKGKNCTEDVDECSMRESCLQGSCTNTNGGYKCDCEEGFIGQRCSMPNPCLRDALNRTRHNCVHGRCVNPIVKLDHGHEISLHECKCDRGYGGPQCSTKVEEERVLALSYILGPIVAVLLVLSLLGCVLFLFVWKGKRALHGHYSPSHQETHGARLQMNNMIKLPPEERLI